MRKILSEKEARQRIAAARKAARAQYALAATSTEPHIVQSGTWWKVMGSDGHQVGTAKRTEAEAKEALDALTGG